MSIGENDRLTEREYYLEVRENGKPIDGPIWKGDSWSNAYDMFDRQLEFLKDNQITYKGMKLVLCTKNNVTVKEEII